VTGEALELGTSRTTKIDVTRYNVAVTCEVPGGRCRKR
jgi:hypothetical protein